MNGVAVVEKIMIVDDDEIVCRIADKILNQKYETFSVNSGEEALEQAEAGQPDLILMDLNMPEMDGYETMEQLKQQSGYDIPVIFMTSEDNIESEVRGLEMGARDYIHKPFKADILLKRIEMVLQNEHTRRVLEKNADADPLTGLLNRRAASREINLYLQEPDANGVLLMMDIDHFKQVNDTYGHKMGDRLLTRVGEVLRSFVRSYDTIARIGGDEFIIFYKNFDSLEHLEERCEKINMRIEYILNDMLGDNSGVQFSMSIGGAFAPRDGLEFSILYDHADAALYYVKQHGRCGYSIYNKSCDGLRDAQTGREIGIAQARRLIEENSSRSGAYRVDYENFRNIFRFLKRRSERESVKAQLILFTMNKKRGTADDSALDNALAEFGNLAENTLRKGDVITCFGHGQYMILLAGTDSVNGKMVADRLVCKWKQKAGQLEFEPEYEIQNLQG